MVGQELHFKVSVLEIGMDSQQHHPSECDEEVLDDPFDIANTKNASAGALRRWRRAALVLNASRRFRYTLDLKREEERERKMRMIRSHAQVIRAAMLFKMAAQRESELGAQLPDLAPIDGFGIAREQLCSMMRDNDINALEQYGGHKGLATRLHTDSEIGISGEDKDIVNRRNTFGSNTFPIKKGKGFLLFLWESWQDLTLIILIIAAVVSLVLGIKTEGIKEGWYDGGSILLAVFLVILVTAISDYRQSLQFQILNEEKRNIKLEVIRGGRRVKISIYDVVVGDVVPLKIGDQVPADGVYISGQSLGIDESSMTGESMIVQKDKKVPFLLAGCKVADGFGKMLVTGVGINTEWGLLMASICEDTGEETPLQVRLNGLATFIGIAGLSVAGFVLTVLIVRYFTGKTWNPDGTVQYIHGKMSFSRTIDGVIKIFTIAVTIVVVAVPEGLPLAVTLTLAYSMRKMMADKALVRRLSACETMGSATTICSDKTGTLTLNQMTVVEAYAGKKKLIPPNDVSQMHRQQFNLCIEAIAANTTGSVFIPKNGDPVEFSGSPTEKAILSWGVELGMDFEAIRSETFVVHVSPFNSEKKRGGVALQLSNSDVHIHWKGAAEIVLDLCTQFLDADGSIKSIDSEKSFFKEVINEMAEKSLRCLAFAYKSCDRIEVPNTTEAEMAQWVLPENNLILLSIVGIKDPCRSGVEEAVRLCTAAGVKVMGRSSPNDKLLLVQALRKGGDVVAVTGDGTNDAPALCEADIGLSLGISGTEVAKESSDIIILDDNFASVVKVVRWGRSVYANIQKFIQFQLTVNVAALVINVVAAVSSGSIPLNAVQLLWVNLIMDTLGALALATEPPTDQLMHRSSVGRREPLVTNIMWRNILVQALYQIMILLVFNFGGSQFSLLKVGSIEHQTNLKNTFIFNAFVFCQIFNEFNARKPDEMNVFKGVTKNPLFMGIIGVTVILQIVIILFLGKLTKTVRLSWQLWILSICIGLVSWPLAIIGKLIPVPEMPMSKLFRIPLQRYRDFRNPLSQSAV